MYLHCLCKYYRENTNKSSRNGTASKVTQSWLYPQLRVRVIDQAYKKGKYFKSKVSSVHLRSFCYLLRQCLYNISC